MAYRLSALVILRILSFSAQCFCQVPLCMAHHIHMLESIKLSFLVPLFPRGTIIVNTSHYLSPVLRQKFSLCSLQFVFLVIYKFCSFSLMFLPGELYIQLTTCTFCNLLILSFQPNVSTRNPPCMAYYSAGLRYRGEGSSTSGRMRRDYQAGYCVKSRSKLTLHNKNKDHCEKEATLPD